MGKHEHVLLASDILDKDGRAALEQVPAEQEGDGWRLLSSPVAVCGIAADDVLRVNADHRFSVIRRGGNVCVQLFFETKTGREIPWLETHMGDIGAVLDTQRANSCALTVPATVGHTALVAFMERFVSANRGTLWQYGNVWDPSNGEPLAWARAFLSL